MEDTKKEKLLIRYLIKEEDYEVESISQTSWDDDMYDINEGEREYLIIEDDEVEDKVRDYIEGCIDDMGFANCFSEDFFNELIYNVYDKKVQDFLFDTVVDELNMEYGDYTDDELISKATELGLDPNEFHPEDGFDREGVIEYIVDEELDSIAREVTYYDYLGDFLGEEFVKDIINEHWNEIFDLDDVVDRCITEDGAGHFLASYDGQEIDLDGNYHAYRVN